MKKIASFTVDHLRLLPGVYVSRRDMAGGGALTTFDLRFTRPNEEPVLDTAPIHAIEHLGATYLRNHAQWGEKIIYFGPMGCRTGFYLILKGELEPEDILGLLKGMLEFITGFAGEIPGASARDCGNYLDMNLSMAKYHAKNYLAVLTDIGPERMRYPE
ncbi:MAG TPA: S-ribosylhomocysteine lyase [Feifaniaceae bacterium]|nr:S-ribosylhomocysteine lyase [Feifaniaceae bacterium]